MQLTHKAQNPHKHLHFACLGKQDVITKKVSDHHPVISLNALFWNIMMQGKTRKDKQGMILGYNNGFGLIECDLAYRQRLVQIAFVIAEIIDRHPSIETLCLCEGPIEPDHVKILFETLKLFSCMKRFIYLANDTRKMKTFYKPDVKGAANWGLLMLADTSYQVKSMTFNLNGQRACLDTLANRFQWWALKKDGGIKYLALAHLPFKGDEHIADKSQLSLSGRSYCSIIKRLMRQYDNDNVIFCADFNLNPYLISHWQDRLCDSIPVNNSILLCREEKSQQPIIKSTTVDGILLSRREKQRLTSLQPIPRLYAKHLAEHGLFKNYHCRSHFLVIPAKTGIHRDYIAKAWMDPRLRGDDNCNGDNEPAKLFLHSLSNNLEQHDTRCNGNI